MIIPNLWERLNILVSAPKCITINSDYALIIWLDARDIPSLIDVQSITDTQIANSRKVAKSNVETQLNHITKAFSLVVLDEINILRVNAGLQPRTINQLKNAIEGKL